MYKTKTTEWHNELKPTENELKIKICLLTLYLNHINENKLIFGRTLKKLEVLMFFKYLLRHRKVNLRTSTYIFYKSTTPASINSAAFGTFLKKSAFCGTQISLFYCLRQHLCHPPPSLPLRHGQNISKGRITNSNTKNILAWHSQ